MNPLQLTGQQWIAGQRSAENPTTFTCRDATSGETLFPQFHEASPQEIQQAMDCAQAASHAFLHTPIATRIQLIQSLAQKLEDSSHDLLDRCQQETALGIARLTGEKSRTVYQARLIAQMLQEGSWVNARIDPGDRNRKPIPKPDIRSLSRGIGPVVVFGASNFPLAISVIGTDTITAFAAGCPVVVKAHPAHAGTCEAIGQLVSEAIAEAGLPPGIFSLLQGASHDTGRRLVTHQATRAVAFTGSLSGGRALMDLAAQRPDPIPVYAEMGSINPVFILPDTMIKSATSLAQEFFASLTLGVGQFCTNPGLMIVPDNKATQTFLDHIESLIASSSPAAMLHSGIGANFHQSIAMIRRWPQSKFLGRPELQDDDLQGPVTPSISIVKYSDLADSIDWQHEIFGPYSTIVVCDDIDQMQQLAGQLSGQLTATVHGSTQELLQVPQLLEILQQKAGRLVFNGFPTGVEVSHAMHHGGPYPAASDPHFTSIGPAAIQRFVRPVCFQNCPAELLPPELQDANPLNIVRRVHGRLTQDKVS